MQSNFEQKLQQDGQSIQAQAENRLAKLNFDYQINQKIKTKKPQLKTNFNGYWRVAAVLCLSVLIWTSVSVQTPMATNNQPMPSIPFSKINQTFKQIPLAIEEQIDQSLRNEQQAIISDLKLLKQQLLSI